MSEKIKCPRCEGGWQVIEEDGQMKNHPCYNCDNTGFICAATLRLNRIDEMVASLASGLLEKKKKAYDQNEDGEGWAFSAAESGMTVREYDIANFAIIEDEVMRAIRQVECNYPNIIDEIVAQILPKTEQPPIEPIKRIEPIDESSGDDVPF